MKIKYRNIPVDFVWENRRAIGFGAVGLPLAIEAISLAQPSKLKNIQRKWNESKIFYISAFSQKRDEADKDFQKRLIISVTVALGVLATCSTLIGVAVIVLPASVAISVALCIIAELALNAPQRLKTPKAQKTSIRNFIAESFHKRAEESKQQAQLRILRNIVHVGVGLALAAGVMYCVASVISGYLAGTSIWNLMSLLPKQTPFVVFLEYATVGAVHGLFAIDALRKGSKGKAVFHLSNMLLSLMFPTLYAALESPHIGMRLHHSIVGLAVNLIPYRSMQILGSLITADAITNTFFYQGYDFMNVMINDYPSQFSKGYAASIGLNHLSEKILTKPASSTF